MGSYLPPRRHVCPLTKDGSIVFCGRLDAGPVRDKQSGTYMILDHKTTGAISPSWLKSFRMSSQMTGYIWGVEQHTPVTVVGAYVNAIQLSKLPGLDDPTRKCRDPEHGGVTYEECQHLHVKSEFTITQRTRQQIKEWNRSALQLARKYQEWQTTIGPACSAEMITTVPQEGMFSNSCNFCEFHDFCHTGRKNWKMLVHEPWKPYKIEEPKK